MLREHDGGNAARDIRPRMAVSTGSGTWAAQWRTQHMMTTAEWWPVITGMPPADWGACASFDEEEGKERRGGRTLERNSYLVDPASSHMLVSKIKPCMCKYKLFCTVKLRMAH